MNLLLLDSSGDNLGLTFPYLYYHIFGVKWSSNALGSQQYNSFYLLVKRLRSVTTKIDR